MRVLIIVFVLIIASCAVQVPPSGGAKDNSSPLVEKMSPENKKVNFNERGINIKFNEFIILNNPNEQIIISPPLDEKPEFEVRGKVLNVTFLNPLKRNTTYTINFGNAVIDNHEGNVIENLRYVFSTGAELDTNIISGTVINSFTGKTEKGISVGLYDAENFYDSIIYKHKPFYFTKSKNDGSFSLENIQDKQFYLVAFNDENKNLKYDKNEDISFIKKQLNATDTSLKDKKIWLFSPDKYAINRILDTFSRELGKYCFLVYKPTNISIKPIKDVKYFTWLSKGKNDIDSLFIFSDQLTEDSVTSFKFYSPDTLYILNIKVRKKLKPPSFNIIIQNKIELNDSIKIIFQNPCEIIDTTLTIFKVDTIRVKPNFNYYNTSEKLFLSYPLNEKTSYTISIKDSAFKDIYKQYNKETRFSFTTKSLKDYSSLKLNLLLAKSDQLYIIQILNEDESTLIKEFIITQGKETLFDYLLPGNYKIKIILDTNKNGKWDNGDFFLKRQPERVFYNPELINLKAYWDLEQTIDLNKLIKF